jgi:cysteine desulfurase
MIYFDHNATTPLHPVARQAWQEAAEKFIGNPSSPHRLGSRADAALGEARRQLAEFLGCDALDIVWTSGATESNNMVLHHAAATLPRDAEVWISAIEHPCVLESTAHYFPGRHRLIPVTRPGVSDLNWLSQRLARARPGLVAVMAANNETGVLQPWREVLALCRKRGIPFFCDAAQWMGKLPSAGLGGCDFVSGCAHKFGGPKGAGFLKVPGKGRFESLLLGGPQEERRRAGTENVPGVLAMLAVLAAREMDLAKGEHERRLKWRTEFEKRLLKKVKGAEVVGAKADRLWNTVSALLPVADCRQRWVVRLDKAGFAASTGSACASGKEQPSHVLAAMGQTAGTDRALRFSSGWETTREEWIGLADTLARLHVEQAG